MKSNQVRLLADSIAKQEIESTLARVTPQNYNSNETNDPLRIGAFTESNREVSSINFTIRRVVSWVDDPADGLYPEDPIPFDYKKLELSVWAPNFTNSKITKTAQLDTLIAREGAADPVTGLIVEVIRGWKDDEGNSIPVSGAYVEISSGSDTQTGVTNENGQIVLPAEFSSEDQEYSVNVQATGMMMHPNPIHNNRLLASRWKTEKIIMEVEKPSQIKLALNSIHLGGTVSLINSELGVNRLETITPGQPILAFDNLWPVGNGYSGQYILSVNNLIAYTQDFAYENGNYCSASYDEEGKAVTNLWNYSNTHRWQSEGEHPEYEGDRWLKSPEIDLINYDCSGFGSASITISGTVDANISSSSDNQGILYISTKDDFPTSQSLREDDWKLFYEQALSKGHLYDEKLEETKLFENINEIRPYLVDSFHVAICSFPEIDSIALKNIAILLGYEENNVQFDTPGETLFFSVNKQS